MLSGELYNATDTELTAARVQARLLLQQLNNGAEDDAAGRASVLGKLFPHAGQGLWLQPPFYCDYGSNIYLGDQVFMNFNCVILDVAIVSIGDRSLLGPNVQVYAASHPMNASQRAQGMEYGKAVNIGSDVWIGGGAIICPGVTIGDRSVIGAGSVVTRDIPADVFAAGNPCRIIRALMNEG